VFPVFTVRELAERVRRPDEDITAVVDRLRNWTKEGLLTHLGPKNPGTGRHRRYSQEGLIEAAVLSALAEVGLPAVRSAMLGPPARTALKLAKHAFRDIDDKYRSEIHVYLIVARTNNKSSRGGDVLPMLQEVRGPSLVEIPPAAESAIVINLTNIALRLFVAS
jgi:hypothetical protein